MAKSLTVVLPAGTTSTRRTPRQYTHAVIARLASRGRYDNSGSWVLLEQPLMTYELDVQVSLDHPSQARYAPTHQRGPLCVGSDVGTSAPLNNAQGTVWFHTDSRSLTRALFFGLGARCQNLLVTLNDE
jgi:hypothetical protein